MKSIKTFFLSNNLCLHWKNMISAFYKFTPSKKQKISRQKVQTEPFMIPQQHLIDNEQDITRLKKQCLKYQREFTFIKNQIERQARLKKEKNRQHFQMDRTQLENALLLKSHNQNREERRKELGITDRELQKQYAEREKHETNESSPSKKSEESIFINSYGISRKINTQTH